MQFFGIQFIPDDNRQDIAELVLRTLEKLGQRCKTLELVDVMDLGSFKYVRFRVDLPMNVVIEVVDAIRAATERNVILPGGVGGYVCKMKGKTGTVPYSKMQTVGREHPKVYRGNALLHWERQFLKDGFNGA